MLYLQPNTNTNTNTNIAFKHRKVCFLEFLKAEFSQKYICNAIPQYTMQACMDAYGSIGQSYNCAQLSTFPKYNCMHEARKVGLDWVGCATARETSPWPGRTPAPHCTPQHPTAPRLNSCLTTDKDINIKM